VTPKQFITELFGEDWKPSQLPVFVDTLKAWSEDAQRYYAVRDFAEKLQWESEPRDRKQCHEFDDLVDAKRFEHDLDEN
jgi:hypothetical protein